MVAADPVIAAAGQASLAGVGGRPRVGFEDAPLRRYHVKVAVATLGGVFSDGFGLGIIGIVLTAANAQLHLTATDLGLLGGASLSGLFAGALFAGPCADRWGRRGLFAYNMALLAGLSIAQFFVRAPWELLLLRLLIGASLGVDYVVSKALLVEFTPRRYRGRLLGALAIAWAGGYVCAYFSGFALATTGSEPWRWMLLSSAVAPLLILPLRLTTPESPLWLINHGEPEKAAQVVGSTLGADIEPPGAAVPALARQWRWSQLWSGAQRPRTVVACTFFACQVIPYFALGTFVARVLSALHVRTSLTGGVLYNLLLLIGAVAGVITVDRLSRRSFLVGSFAVTAIILFALCAYDGWSDGAIIFLFATFAAVLSAATALVYVYLPELFPTDLRASGIGMAIAASRLGSAISTFLLPIVVEGAGARVALAACAAVLAIGCLVCYLLAPETRNLRLSGRS
jgi:MFS transporter, putative metabolite transport protein